MFSRLSSTSNTYRPRGSGTRSDCWSQFARSETTNAPETASTRARRVVGDHTTPTLKTSPTVAFGVESGPTPRASACAGFLGGIVLLDLLARSCFVDCGSLCAICAAVRMPQSRSQFGSRDVAFSDSRANDVARAGRDPAERFRSSRPRAPAAVVVIKMRVPGVLAAPRSKMQRGFPLSIIDAGPENHATMLRDHHG